MSRASGLGEELQVLTRGLVSRGLASSKPCDVDLVVGPVSRHLPRDPKPPTFFPFAALPLLRNGYSIPLSNGYRPRNSAEPAGPGPPKRTGYLRVFL